MYLSWTELGPAYEAQQRGFILGLAPPPTRREELAEFLRHHRESTSPESVGLATIGRRRTPGLRREEVSQLAGVGLSWYTWLEQGREITPSASVLDALARVLDLDPPEHAHLFALADVPVPASAEPYPTEAPPELREVVLGMEPNPAFLLGPRTDVLVWNAGARRMLGQPSAAPDGIPNLLWWLFTDRWSPRASENGGADPRAISRRARPPLRRSGIPEADRRADGHQPGVP